MMFLIALCSSSQSTEKLQQQNHYQSKSNIAKKSKTTTTDSSIASCGVVVFDFPTGAVLSKLPIGASSTTGIPFLLQTNPHRNNLRFPNNVLILFEKASRGNSQLLLNVNLMHSTNLIVRIALKNELIF